MSQIWFLLVIMHLFWSSNAQVLNPLVSSPIFLNKFAFRACLHMSVFYSTARLYIRSCSAYSFVLFNSLRFRRNKEVKTISHHWRAPTPNTRMLSQLEKTSSTKASISKEEHFFISISNNASEHITHEILIESLSNHHTA